MFNMLHFQFKKFSTRLGFFTFTFFFFPVMSVLSSESGKLMPSLTRDTAKIE